MGGAGNDVLNFNHGTFDQGEWGLAEGGADDDTITVRTDALVPSHLSTDVGGVHISGGSGADEIDVIYELTDEYDDADETFAGDFIRVDDFDPNEDLLTIVVDNVGDAADRDITVELDQTEDDGTYTSLVTLTFAETEEMPEATNVLTVLSAAPFTLEDIQLVGI